jgi:hypothetical protein
MALALLTRRPGFLFLGDCNAGNCVRAEQGCAIFWRSRLCPQDSTEADELRSKLDDADAERRALISKIAELGAANEQLRAEGDLARQQLEDFGAAPILDIDARRQELQ